RGVDHVRGVRGRLRRRRRLGGRGIRQRLRLGGRRLQVGVGLVRVGGGLDLGVRLRQRLRLHVRGQRLRLQRGQDRGGLVEGGLQVVGLDLGGAGDVGRVGRELLSGGQLGRRLLHLLPGRRVGVVRGVEGLLFD